MFNLTSGRARSGGMGVEDGRRVGTGDGRRRLPARVEPLEGRTLLTVVIDPIFGAEGQAQDGSDGKMHRPAINLLFWGSFWQGTNGSDPSQWISSNSPAQPLIDAAEAMIQSAYFNVTEQYGADPANMFLNDVRWDPSNPATVFDSGKIDDVVQNQIDHSGFPGPDDQQDGHGHHVPPIYVVITPPGISSSDSGAGGFNTENDDKPEVWIGTASKPGITVPSPDRFTKFFGHEVGEIMTDLGNNGFEVNTPAAWATGGIGGDNQIGDKEGNSYSFRLSDSGQPASDVQPLWSRDDQAWVVTDGTAQTFRLHPNWDLTDPTKPKFLGTFALTINGDQWLNINDQLTLSKSPTGQITINLNGEVVNFDPGSLSSIQLNLKSGSNSVYLMNSPGIPIDMNCTSPFGGDIDLHGPDGVRNSWNITGADIGNLGGPSGVTFSDVDSITGGNMEDSFNFFPGGSLSGSIDGAGPGATGNSLNFSNFTDALHPFPVEVDLQTHGATPLGRTFSNISFINGTNLADTLIGSDAGDHWTVSGANAGADGNVFFSSFENLVGGSGDDTFSFYGNSLASGYIAADLDGGGGRDTLDYSHEAGPVFVDFSTHTATGVLGTFANIEAVIGSQSPNDVIIGPDAVWLISGQDAGSVNGITFSSFENLTGSPATDTFTFMPGGAISGNLDGGGGADTLDYSNLSTGVTLDFANHTATGIGGHFSNITSILPGSGGISVVGPDAPTTWTITGVNAVSAFGFNFTNTPSITGGAGNDTFVFQSGGRLDGKIDGGAGTNTLTYASAAGDVVVDLRLGTATGAGGGIANIQNVAGGNGNTLLVGDANANVLTGGAGRNILIGGAGPDTLAGGGGDDILIAGSTIYDANSVALAAIFAEWNRTDISFQKRVSDLISGGGRGLNGSFTLDKKSVLSDLFSDTLIGGNLDWFFVDGQLDAVSGRTPADHVTQLA